MTISGPTLALVLFLALFAGLIALPVAAYLVIGRPWTLKGLALLDRLRIANAVCNYDAWLSLRGIPVQRRRALRTELGGNLWESARESGARVAIQRVGSLRMLAAEAPATTRPRWALGAVVALLAFELFIVLQLVLTSVWLDGTRASGATQAEGAISIIPGMRASVGPDSLGMSPGPASLVVAALAFVLVAQPWRAFRRSVQHLAAHER